MHSNNEPYGVVYFLTPIMEKNYYLFLEMISGLDTIIKANHQVIKKPSHLTEQCTCQQSQVCSAIGAVMDQYKLH